MELLYLWIKDDGINIKNQSFNFSNHISFSFIESSEFFGTVHLTENPNFIDGFFTEFSGNSVSGEVAENRDGVMNVTGVIGENGAGKTNLLNYITKLLSDGLPIGTEFIVAFKDRESKEIRIFHTLEGYDLSAEGEVIGYIINDPIEQTVSYPFDNPIKDPSSFTKDSRLIYYNPIFDLRDYPSNISNENKRYIDVSTNALIENDVLREGDRYPEDIKEIELHKYSNIRRQFDMLINSSLADIKGLNLPSQVSLIFHRDYLNPDKGKRNLSYESTSIYKYLDKLVDSAWGEVNTELTKAEGPRIPSFKSKNGMNNSRNSYSYKQALAKKLKIEFTYSFLNNYFINLNTDSNYNIDIGIKLKDLKGESLFENAKFFFDNQKWNSRSKKSFVKAGPFYRVILDLIDQIDLNENMIEDNANSFITDITGGVEAISNYENYILSIPTEHKKNFMTTTWRNISSGENALMDLYSRMFFAKQKIIKKKDSNRVAQNPFLYILIDEGEVGFHPQWQSEYLYNLLSFVNRLFYQYEVQIILTSHSPFLVSDLPKENLIFLEKINGMCSVASFNDEQTFAANIHRLLSSQFFLRNGVIGKFAQIKLQQELAPLLENKKLMLNEERLKKVIALIGEPVVKSKLTEIFASKRNS